MAGASECSKRLNVRHFSLSHGSAALISAEDEHSLHIIRSQIAWEIDTVETCGLSPHGHSSGLWFAKTLCCGSPKLCPCAFSTAWIVAIHRPTAIRAAHVLHHRGPNWYNAPGLSYSPEPFARKPRSSAAALCAQAQASQATDCCAR